MKPAASTLKHRALLWVLACLIPLQGMAASVLATLGPAHVHRAANLAPPELEDFRRAPLHPALRLTHVDSMFGHFHSDAAPLRHHHAGRDATVVLVGDDAAQQVAGADESNLSPALGALVTMIPSVVAWLAPAPTSVRACGDAWASLTNDPEPFERPPRPA